MGQRMRLLDQSAATPPNPYESIRFRLGDHLKCQPPAKIFLGTMQHAEAIHQEYLVEEGIPKALGDAAVLIEPGSAVRAAGTLVLVE